MELRQTSYIHEKISGIINNRNLKDYSCFIGVKTFLRRCTNKFFMISFWPISRRRLSITQFDALNKQGCQQVFSEKVPGVKSISDIHSLPVLFSTKKQIRPNPPTFRTDTKILGLYFF